MIRNRKKTKQKHLPSQAEDCRTEKKSDTGATEKCMNIQVQLKYPSNSKHMLCVSHHTHEDSEMSKCLKGSDLN